MFNALKGLVAQSANYLITQAFINQLRMLCQQAYYNPYGRDAVHQQITAAVYNAFNNCPPQGYEQLASNILSALFNFPVQAAQLRLLGPAECVRRYPLYTPVIYAIADVLMPGWRQSQTSQGVYVPLSTPYRHQQPVGTAYTLASFPSMTSPVLSAPYSPPVASPIVFPPYSPPVAAPAVTPTYSTLSSWPTLVQTTPSLRPAAAAQAPVSNPVSLPLRPAAPQRAHVPTPLSYPPPTERPSPAQSLSSRLSPNPVKAPFDIAAYLAKTPEQQGIFKKDMAAKVAQHSADLDAEMEKILRDRNAEQARADARSGPKSALEVRRDELLREISDAAAQRDDFMRAANHILQNPGMNAKQLGRVGAPLRNQIRDMMGEGVLDQFDSVLREQTQKDTEKTASDASSRATQRSESTSKDPSPAPRSFRDAGAWGLSGASPADPLARLRVGMSLQGPGRIESKPAMSALGSSLPKATTRVQAGAVSWANIADHVRRIRNDRLHSRWRESQCHVRALTTEERAHPKVALELGRTLFAQGWARKALDAVEVSWFRWGDSWPDPTLLNALRLLAAFLNIICNYQVKGAMAAALAIRRIDEELGAVENLSLAELSAETFYCKIIDQALYEGFLDEETFKPPLVKRVRDIALWLQAASRTHDALAFSLLLVDAAGNVQEKEDILRPYLQDQNLLAVDKGDICLQLANVLAEAERASERDKLLQDAEDAFKEDQNLEGELKVQLKRLTLLKRRSSADVQSMLEVADSFANLSSPTAEVNALNTARTAAFELHPEDSQFLQIHERTQRLCVQTGNKFAQLQASFAAACALVMWPQHIGKATEALHRYLETGVEDLPQTKGQLATILGPAYLMLGDRENGIKYAKSAVQAFQHTCNYEALSTATWGLASAITQGETNPIDYHEAIRMLEESAELDKQHKFVAGQTRAYETLVTLEGMLALSDQTGWHQSRRDHWVEERQKITNTASRRDAIDKIRLHLTKKEFDKAEELATEALDQYIAEDNLANVALCRGILFSCRLRPFNIYLPRSRDQLLKATEILVRARKAVAAYKALGPGGIGISFVIEVSIAFENLGQYLPDRKSVLSAEALGYLELGEAICEQMREDLPSLSGLPSLLQKRILVGYKYHQEINTRALRLAAASGDPAQVWKWTQKSKGKALSDMVASRPLSTGTVTALDMEDEGAVTWLEEEAELLKNLESASEFKSITIRTQLDQVRGSMKGRSALGHLLRSRAGKIELDDLDWVFDSPASSCIPRNRKIVLVDWVVIDDAIVMLTVDSSRVPHITTLDLTWSQVRLWKRKNLMCDKPLMDPRTYQTTLDEINGLVAGLENFTAIGDLLVLCPSVDLHAIPLHALNVGSRVLIARNLVIYTTSLSLLRLCCGRAIAKSKTRPSIHSLKTNFFAPNETKFDESEGSDESRLVAENVTQLAAEFVSVPHLGRDANRQNFEELSRKADIFHYHGHMDYGPNDILSQALVLHDNPQHNRRGVGKNEGSVPLSESQRRDKQRNVDFFTVRDLFSLRLDLSLATMIACSSGVQEVAPGDEPIGLLAALLFAGCATSVGTLWPVANTDGRYLALAFYQDLHARMAQMPDDRAAQSPLNMAISFCRAVRRLMRDESRDSCYLPYHWAPFVMHGAWFI